VHDSFLKAIGRMLAVVPQSTQKKTVHSSDAMTPREIWSALVGLMSGMFLSSLDQTVVGTAMRTISDDLNGLSLQAWVTTAYLITSTVVTPIAGKLSDIYGRRPIYMASIFIFSDRIDPFRFRVVDAHSRDIPSHSGNRWRWANVACVQYHRRYGCARERAKYQGFFIAVFGSSSGLGPLVGGFFAGTDQILWIDGWRWVFLVDIPIGAIAVYMVWRFLHVPQIRHKR